MVYCIGLTGNIACGKSTVASFFQQLGISIFNADLISKQLTETGKEAYKKILHHFGSTIIQKDRQLNRKKLREIIFTNPQERLWLEALLHPMIREKLTSEIELSSSPYCIVEIPLLKNKKHYPYIKQILLVTSPIETQIERLMNRDHCTRKQALAIIKTQPPYEQRLALADHELINDGNLIKLKAGIDGLHLYYLNQAKINQ